jgi:hypothetical protein
VLEQIRGNNLYEFALNAAISSHDSFGLDVTTPQTGPNSFACALATKNYENAVAAANASGDDLTAQQLMMLAGLRNAMNNACKNPPSPPTDPTCPVTESPPNNIITLPPMNPQQGSFCQNHPVVCGIGIGVAVGVAVGVGIIIIAGSGGTAAPVLAPILAL